MRSHTTEQEPRRRGRASSRALVTAALLALALPAAAAAPERVVALVPLGKVDPALIEIAVAAIEGRVNARVRVEPARTLPRAAWYEPRKRWRAEKLLDFLDADLPAGAWRVVGLTQAEISTTKDEHVDWRVGGLGSIGGPSCVVSTWIFERHSKTREVLRRRLDDLVAHEFGHTLGIGHCPTARCLMRDAEGRILRSVDSSDGRFCARCRQIVGEGVLVP